METLERCQKIRKDVMMVLMINLRDSSANTVIFNLF